MVERIRTLLETRQLTPTQFADAIGIARPIVSHILSGRNKPSLEVVQRILAAMPDLSMPWLLNGTGPMQADAIVAAAAPPAPRQAAPVMTLSETETPAVQSMATPKEPPAPSLPVAEPPVSARSSQAPAPARPMAIDPATRPAPKRFTPSLAQQVPAPGPAPQAVPEPMPTPENPAAQEVPAAPAAVPAAVAAEANPLATALLAGGDKPIRRIVIFYRDGSFSDFQPE